MRAHAELTTASVLQALSRHIGETNGIRGKDLVIEMLGGTSEYRERRLRRIVERLRTEGHHICGIPEEGYYLAATPEELDHTCLFLHDRAMTTLKQIAAMKRVSLPDLKGQLHLPT
jgi:hypothetical protein